MDRVGLHEVSREPDDRVYLRAWDEFDRHSVILRQDDTPGMDMSGSKLRARPISTHSAAASKSSARRSRKFPAASSRVSAAG